MPTITVGQVIDSYRIVRPIGEGGMGAVYEAVHVVLGQRVAIKVLTSDFRAQPALLQRFINEARAASQINHPGIVKVYDLGHFDDGLPWLSMEYLDGRPLSSRIHATARRGRPLGMDDFWIIGDIASALAAAHKQGIIHRDLKPANVMVVPDPATLSGERAKVLDFGVAKLHTDQLTKRGAILGTPLYMALEQFKDSAEVDGRADVFSLGVIAYEVLSSKRPHNGQTHFEVMGARMMAPIPPIGELVPALPAEVAGLVMRMLEREPALRPTMIDVELAVRRALGLPPPRKSGWHEPLTPESAPEAEQLAAAAAGGPRFDSNAPTPDVAPGAAAPLPTPSSEKGLGELTPPSAVRVPESLSSQPSLPVPLVTPPPMPGFEVSTAKPAPALYIPPPVVTALPPAPGPSRRRVYKIGAAVLAGSLALAAGTVVLWPSHQPSKRGGVLQPQAPPPQPAPPVPIPTSVPTPIPPLAPPVNPLVEGETKGNPAPPVEHESPHLKKTANPAHTHARECEPQPPSAESCTSLPALNEELHQRLLSALRGSGATWCAGEPLVLSGLPDSPAIGSAPPSLHEELRQPLLFTLRGMLRGRVYPAKVKVTCKAR